jgi:hypothetical protein
MSETTEDAAPEVTATVSDPSQKKMLEKWVGHYVAVRDMIAKIKERHTKELEDYVDLQEKLTGRIQGFLDQHGADSVKTELGTAYSSVKFTASLNDPAIFMSYVIKTNDFDLLDRKANLTAVKAYVKQHGTLPPGVNLTSIKQLGVRRPAKKS